MPKIFSVSEDNKNGTRDVKGFFAPSCAVYMPLWQTSVEFINNLSTDFTTVIDCDDCKL